MVGAVAGDRAQRLHAHVARQSVPYVDESQAVLCPLRPGEASFHHGWTLHASLPNASDDPRIGLDVRYITPAMRQLVNPRETALLVRGRDPHHHYREDQLATRDCEPAAVARHAEIKRLRKATRDQATRSL